VKKQKNGMYVAEFSKMNSVALTAWFLQYVNIFKVISPETLKKDIIKEVKSAIEKYSIS
jgi:predicted DNA-binding transcriptional regulator YafY